MRCSVVMERVHDVAKVQRVLRCCINILAPVRCAHNDNIVRVIGSDNRDNLFSIGFDAGVPLDALWLITDFINDVRVMTIL